MSKATQGTPRRRPEHLARLHHPRDRQRRDAEALHRRTVADRADVESDDLRQGAARRVSSTTSRSPSCSSRASAGRTCSSSLRSPTCRARPTCSGPSTTAPTASTGSCRSRSRRSSPTTGSGRQRPRRSCTARPIGRTCSSRSRAPRRGSTRSRESIAAGIPVNVTLLFDAGQYRRQADAYMAGIEKRIENGEEPERRLGRVDLRQPLGRRRRRRSSRKTSRIGSASPRRSAPTSPTASCSTPIAGSVWPTRAPGRSGCCSRRPERRTRRFRRRSTCVELAAPDTVDTMPEETLLALAEEDGIGDLLPADGGDNEELLARFEEAGVDLDDAREPAPVGGRQEVRGLVVGPARGDLGQGECRRDRRLT